MLRSLHGWPALLVLLSAMVSAGYFASQFTSLTAEDYRDQYFRAKVADEFVQMLRVHITERGEISHLALLQRGKYFADLFPDSDFYLLDSEGTITHAFNAEIERLVLRRVPLKPIQEMLENRALPHGPIYIPMPDDPTFQSVFSVAPLTISGKEGYAFVILHNRTRRLFTISWMEYRHLVGTMGLLVLTLIALLATSYLLRGAFRRILGRVHTLLGTLAPEIQQVNLDASSGLYEEQMIGIFEGILNDRARLQGRENEAKHIIAQVAHDVRTPLMLLQDYADRLLATEDVRSVQENHKEGARIRRNVRSLTALISDLDIFDELKDSKQSVQLEPLQIEELIEELVSVYSISASAREVQLLGTHNVQPLPPVAADSALVERILRNLLENAIRHTPAGGSVQVRAHASEAGVVRISVVDTGIGMSEHDLSHIFEPFYQASGDSVENGSSGLGLAIAEQAARSMGSSLRVESVENHGSTFWFELSHWENSEHGSIT